MFVLCSRVFSVNPIYAYPCAVSLSLSDPPEFSPEQPKQVQVVEDDMATIPLLVSANPAEVSCIWLHHREKLVKGDSGPCDGSITGS